MKLWAPIGLDVTKLMAQAMPLNAQPLKIYEETTKITRQGSWPSHSSVDWLRYNPRNSAEELRGALFSLFSARRARTALAVAPIYRKRPPVHAVWPVAAYAYVGMQATSALAVSIGREVWRLQKAARRRDLTPPIKP